MSLVYMGIFSKARHLAIAKAQSQQYIKNVLIVSFKRCLRSKFNQLTPVCISLFSLTYMHEAFELPKRKAFVGSNPDDTTAIHSRESKKV